MTSDAPNDLGEHVFRLLLDHCHLTWPGERVVDTSSGHMVSIGEYRL